MTTIYAEDAGWLHDGAPIGGCESKEPLQLDLADMLILRSGFALRDDDQWRLSQLRDLAECHNVDVAHMIDAPMPAI